MSLIIRNYHSALQRLSVAASNEPRRKRALIQAAGGPIRIRTFGTGCPQCGHGAFPVKYAFSFGDSTWGFPTLQQAVAGAERVLRKNLEGLKL